MKLSDALSPEQYKALAAEKPKRSKYGNKPVILAGHRFDSIAEANRYEDLCGFEQAGLITDLVCHPRYKLAIGGFHICTYEADFSFKDEFGRVVVEDVKGVQTQVFKLKAKLFRALYGHDITITKGRR